MNSDEICPYDKCPTWACGGPHFEIETTLGMEVLKEGQTPIGFPVSEMSESQIAEHNAAKRAATNEEG